MFRTFLDRLLSRPTSPPPSAIDPVPIEAAPVAAQPPTRTTPRPPRPPGPPPIGLGARRPLVGPEGALAGFEFHAGAASRLRLRRIEDETTIRACTANVLGAMRHCIGDGSGPRLMALAEFPATWLARSDDAAFCAGMALVLVPDALFNDAAGLSKLVGRLRNAGAMVGWRAQASSDADANAVANAFSGAAAAPEAGSEPASIAPDFLLLSAPPAAGLEAWQQARDALRSRSSGIPLVLLDVPDVDVLEALLAPPLMLAACVAGALPPLSQVQALSPQASRLLQLLNRLVRDDDQALLIAEIKADAALGLRLVQYANSPGISFGHALASVDQAVGVLGRDAMYRWAAQMLVRLSTPRSAAEALQAMALARARLFELLGRSIGASDVESLYLFGLVSMLPLLLGCSAEAAVASLQLPMAALDALHRQQGPWHPYLALALALERQDMAGADLLARPFNGLDAVLACSVRAWLPR